MTLFNRASNITINGGYFVAQSTQSQGGWEMEKYALQKLEQHVAFGAFHNSKERYDAPKCLPRTREAVFQEISEWIHNTSIKKPILWLYGPAGAGKSAIAQSTAEKVYQGEIPSCLLLGTFFFNRSSGERNNAERLISSLAYQMISSIPDTRQSVLKAIIELPHVFSLNLMTQMEKLIIEPLRALAARGAIEPGGSPPILIIIDGLDECKNSKERIESIAALSKSVQTPPCRVVILCHSRPESDIRTAFNNPAATKLSSRIVLDNRFKPDSDIQRLLDHDFSEIKQIHPLNSQLPQDWPPMDVLRHLVRKSSGQFIYASTVMKYIASRKHSPMKRLEVVLKVGSGGNASPFKELDALYALVLSSVEEDDRPTLVRVIGMICFPGLYGQVKVTPRLLDDVLGLQSGGTILILDDLYSLFHVGNSEDTLRPFHASFGDFLQDMSRSNEYHVDRGMAKADSALAYLKVALYQLVPSSPEHQIRGRPDERSKDLENLNLTVELSEFFKNIPWQQLLKNGLPLHRFSESLAGRKWFDSPNDYYIFDLYDFCKRASLISPTWATLYAEALAEIAAWLVGQLKLTFSKFSSTTPAIIPSIQHLWRERYIRGRVLKLRHDGTIEVLILDILQTKGLPGIAYINRQRHNRAVFETILEGLVTNYFTIHTVLVHEPPFLKCKKCRECLATLFNSADRTSNIDALLPYIEVEASLVNLTEGRPVIDGVAEVMCTIKAYKKKPVPDNYVHGFQLKPSMKALRERYRQIHEGNLFACRFTLLEKQVG